MKAGQWIDRVKVARGWDSDYRAAKELGLSRNTISNYRTRTPTLDEETAIRVAHALEVDPVIVVADQAMERARTDEARSVWAGILTRLGVGQEKAPQSGADGGWRRGRDSNPR